MSGKECVFDFLHTKSTLPGPILGGRYTLVPGERLNGIQEVSGSIPLISTISRRAAFKNPFPKGNGFLFYRELSPTNSSVSLGTPAPDAYQRGSIFHLGSLPAISTKAYSQHLLPRAANEDYRWSDRGLIRHIRAGRVRSVPAYIL